MSEVDIITSLVIGVISFEVIMIFPLMLWMKLGGHPEGTYRILRIDYVRPIFIDAGNTPRSFFIKTKNLKTGAPELPPYFIIKEFANAIGRYYAPAELATRHNGRNSWYYHPDNPFPIVGLTKRTMTIPISAEQLEKAFNDETVLDFLKVGKERKSLKASNKLMYAGLGLIVFATIIGALYFFGRH